MKRGAHRCQCYRFRKFHLGSSPGAVEIKGYKNLRFLLRLCLWLVFHKPQCAAAAAVCMIVCVHVCVCTHLHLFSHMELKCMT